MSDPLKFLANLLKKTFYNINNDQKRSYVTKENLIIMSAWIMFTCFVTFYEAR